MAGVFRELVIKRIRRSPEWPKVRKEHLQLHPQCECCGKKKKFGMQVHHIVPFHVEPSLELVFDNLLTLCNNPRCHLDKGHLGYWASWNVAVLRDCKVWKRKYKMRPLLRRS